MVEDVLKSIAKEQNSSDKTAWYAVSVLLIAYTLSFIDRTILALLIEPIKADMQISDTQVSLLLGIAFALFYTLMGIPLGRLADQYSRRWIIAIGVFFWSLMTAASGITKSYGQLFLARVGVGVGEAALSPAAYSMIADYFEPAKLGRALGIYTAGVYLGAGLAFIIGGQIAQYVASMPKIVIPLFGEVAAWQATFFAVGLPGILVALLVLTVREPARRANIVTIDVVEPQEHLKPTVSVKRTFGFLKDNWKIYGTHFLGFSLLGLSFNAVLAWAPTMLIRKFGWTVGEAGYYLGADIFLFGTLGIIAGGWFSDKLTQRGYGDATILTGIVSAIGSIPFVLLATLVPNAIWSALLFAPFMFFAAFAYGAAAAALQITSPNEMRAQISAIYLFVLNLLGIGLGPTLVALVTDYIFADETAVDWSLAVVATIACILGAIVLVAARKPFRDALAR